MRTKEPSSFPHARNPEPLAKALARWSRHADPPKHPFIFAGDNDWAQSHFLVELLLHAKPRRPWLDRDRVREILRNEGGGVTLERLEGRGWVRFIVGQLEIPKSVRGELLHAKHEEALPAPERAALHVLVKARDNNEPLFWLEGDQFERIYRAHSIAHILTPSLQELQQALVIHPATHEGREGYALPWRKSKYEALTARVVGLYWEALMRGAPPRNYNDADDCNFRKWLIAVFEFHGWSSFAEHMTKTSLARLVKAAKRCILQETDLLDPEKEVDRVLFEAVGFERPSNLSLPARLPHDASLLDICRWFDRSALFESTGPRPLRTNLNWLISLVIAYDPEVCQGDLLELVRASRDIPYLIYQIRMSMGTRSNAIAAFVAHVESASFGMLLLAERSVRSDSDFNWEERGHQAQLHETEKNRLWREAVGVLLGTIYDEIREEPLRSHKHCARALGETLLLAVPSLSQRSHLPDVDDVLRASAAERLDILLAETSISRSFVLVPLLADLHAFLAARVDAQSRPTAELRILLWLLRTLNADGNKFAVEIQKVADTILHAYTRVILCQEFDDFGNLKSWHNDEPGIVDLPWTDLVAYLHRNGRSGEMLTPNGIELHDRLLRSYQSERYQGGEDHHSWIRKTRMHLRVLLATHAHFAKRDFVPAMVLNAKQRDDLLTSIENQISLLVTKCAKSAHDGVHGSLFAPDAEFFSGGITGADGLFMPLMRRLTRFTSPDRRNELLAGWIHAENDPTVLLAMLDHNLPAAVKERAIIRLSALDIEQVVKDARQVTRWMEMARTANIANRPEIVKAILDYGNNHLSAPYREKEWALFEYEMRLMLAYNARNEADLDEVQPPPIPERYRHDVGSHVQDDILDKREFYRGLIKLDKDPSKAREIFQGLVAKYPETISHAINMTAASLRFAKRIEDHDERKQQFVELLHEWESIERTFPASTLAHYHHNLASIRLIALDGACDDNAFDAAWARTDIDTRIDIDIVTLGVKNARRRGLREKANEMLAVARPYYVDMSGNVDERWERLHRNPAVTQSSPAAATNRNAHVEFGHRYEALAGIVLADKIDEGAYAGVWRGKDANDQHVAVKIFSPDKAAECNVMMQAKALARARHPNVVTVFDTGKVDDPDSRQSRDCIVMEYIPGKTLGEILNSCPPLALEDCRRITEGILDGLEHIHAQGMVHGDLHEGNIMVGEEVVKIIDIFYQNTLAALSAKSKLNRVQEDMQFARRLLGWVLERSVLGVDAGDVFERHIRTSPLTISNMRMALAHALASEISEDEASVSPTR